MDVILAFILAALIRGEARPAPVLAPLPALHVEEDSPLFLCAIHGNRVCGPVAPR